IPVAAVTGSNGKTTTKELMASVLAALGPVLKPEGSFNNQWGRPLTRRRLGAEQRALALELGADHHGEIASLPGVRRPTVAGVPVVASAHTEFFGSLDGVQAEKSALVRAIPPDGTVVLNADDVRVIAMRDLARGPVLTFSARGHADVRSVGPVEDGPDGLSFTLEIAGNRRPVRMRFAGAHNVINALAAAGVGVAVGLPLERIVEGLEAARPAKGRCVWRRAGSIRLLDDTYNANPTSVTAALAALGRETGPRRVVVLGDMLELGEVAERAHRDAGRAVAAAGVAEFIAMGTHAEAAVVAAREAGLVESHHTTTFEDTVAL